MEIAIVGCGIGGIHILKTIIEHPNYNDNFNIHIFETRDELGLGPAYEDDTIYKLLNVKEKYMSLDIDDPSHLFDWLAKNPDKDIRVEGMIPRSIFGDYIKDTYSKYLSADNIKIHHEEVVDIEKSDDEYIITTTDNTYDNDFNVIFLSIGQSHYSDDYDLKGEDNFIYDPYPLEKKLALEGNNQNTRIGIIGTGPTSVDIYRYLRENCELDQPFYFFTKSSGFAAVEIPLEDNKNICSIDDDWISKNQVENGFIDLNIIKETIKSDQEASGYSLLETYEKYKDSDIEIYKKALVENDQALAFSQIYTMELWKVAARLYNSLSGLDKLEVDEEYLGKLDFLISKTPTETMKNIIDDYDKGKIKVIRKTEDISVDNKRFIVTSEETSDISVDYLVNSQGFEKNLKKAIKKDKLIQNLYDKKMIEDDVDGKYIRVTYPSYNLINTKYGLMENLYLAGMWTESTDILNNDLRSILQSSELMANDFMEKLTK